VAKDGSGILPSTGKGIDVCVLNYDRGVGARRSHPPCGSVRERMLLPDNSRQCKQRCDAAPRDRHATKRQKGR
jgi:hypothetical protein